MNYEEFTPEQLKEQHQQGMMEDLMRTSDKWAKEHGINMKDIPPDEPLPKAKAKPKQKPVVKYYYNKKTGIRYKHTLLATIRGNEAKALQERNMDHCLYWSYNSKKNTLEIYDEKMLTPLD
jgi:hypothetical protein